MVKRSLGTIMLVAVLMLGVMATSALALEGPGIEYSEIRDNVSEVGAEFLPPEYEMPGFFDWLIFPLIGLGVLITAVTLFRYLVAQPRFEREAEEKSRR